MRAVILAGGKGKRLAPYTTVLPKPLLPLGEMPILEVVLRQLRVAGVSRATIAAGYLSDLLRTFFGNGDRVGLQIDYSIEDRPLGTVGPLTLIDGLDDTFLLMNGDILTDIDFNDLVRRHRSRGAVATIATYIRHVDIDFGVVKTDSGGFLTEYVEKPRLDYRVSMGIYAFEPSVLQHLVPGERLDFPDLVKKLLDSGEKVWSYPFSGYWLDMGRPDDYARAAEEFEAQRGRFLVGVDPDALEDPVV